MIDTFGGRTSEPKASRELSETMVEKIFAAAQPGAVFSAPVVAGAHTIITASEVGAGGGFGFGSGLGAGSGPRSGTGQASDTPSGSGGSGGGAGGAGASSGRPVAAIVIGPDGVRVQPIVDVSKIALAAIGACLSVALVLARRSRGGSHR